MCEHLSIFLFVKFQIFLHPFALLWVKCSTTTMYGKARAMSFLGFESLFLLLPVKFLSLLRSDSSSEVFCWPVNPRKGHLGHFTHFSQLKASLDSFPLRWFMDCLIVIWWTNMLLTQPQHSILRDRYLQQRPFLCLCVNVKIACDELACRQKLEVSHILRCIALCC